MVDSISPSPRKWRLGQNVWSKIKIGLVAISSVKVLRSLLKTFFSSIKSGTSTLGFVGISAIIKGIPSSLATLAKIRSILSTILLLPSTAKSTTSTLSIQAATRLAWSFVPP